MARLAFFRGILLLAHAGLLRALYAPIREYSGQSFFDRWDFPGAIDNTTWGNVTYVDHSSATDSHLAFVNDAGNAVIRVDNSSTVAPNSFGLAYRDSVKIISQDMYPLGSLITVDIAHLPSGCSVWPSFWTLGGTDASWPMFGEIDIIEGVNKQSANQMALHTNISGCVQPPDAQQLGKQVNGDCSDEAGTVGCRVTETKANSFGDALNAAGGGVFALQFDVAGAYIWFWSRPNIPPSISSASMTSNIDTVDWGLPSAAYPASGCDLQQLFLPQRLIFDITLCGAWAGVPSLFAQDCDGSCVADYVIGLGSGTYDNAFFEIAYVRTYTITNTTVSSSISSSASSIATATDTATSTGTLTSTEGPGASSPASSSTSSGVPTSETTGAAQSLMIPGHLHLLFILSVYALPLVHVGVCVCYTRSS